MSIDFDIFVIVKIINLCCILNLVSSFLYNYLVGIKVRVISKV